MVTPLQKGDALEAAVAAIERHILQASPALREKTFLIESKKVITVGGVRHEIDIFVTIDLGKGYKSFYIFECKNWQDSVGKNEVIVFSEKIAVTQSQSGFFVAKSFTKDARSQAEKDPRIILLIASENDPTMAPVPFGFHGIISIPEHVDSTFRRRGSHAEPALFDISKVKARSFGKEIDLRQFLLAWAEQTCNDSLLSYRSEKIPDGIYDRTAAAEREFGAGELLLDDLDIEHAKISARFKVRVFRPAVISYFEIESRGHALTFAPVDLPQGGTMQMTLVSG